MPANWSFRLADKTHTPIGEVLNASERTTKIGIRQIDTASFKIGADNPLLLPLFAEDTHLQVWQDGSLRFYGPVVSSAFVTDENGNGADTVAVNAVSPLWRLTKRLSGKETNGKGTEFKGYDKANVAKTLIDALNSEAETGIETTSISSGSTGTYTAGPFKPTLTCIRELANGFDGFDWKVTPLPESGVKLGRFDASALIGSTLPDVVFEYGCGKNNMRSMSFTRDLSGMLNLAYHITDNGAADPAGIISVENPTSAAEHGRFEGVVESAGLFDSGLREAWARENVEVRGVPRLIATMTSDFIENDGRIPEAFVDYSPGDMLVARARSNGVQLFDGYVRCYNIEVSVDVAGNTTYTPTIVEEEGVGAEAA